MKNTSLVEGKVGVEGSAEIDQAVEVDRHVTTAALSRADEMIVYIVQDERSPLFAAGIRDLLASQFDTPIAGAAFERVVALDRPRSTKAIGRKTVRGDAIASD